MAIPTGRFCTYCQVGMQSGEGVSVEAETEKYGIQTFLFCCRYDAEYWKMSLGEDFIRWVGEFAVGANGEKFWRDDRLGIFKEKNDYIWRNGHLYP